tara:strand:+ start:239 stop:433 length:195 start_codon:yes stop_codon:yes gene_type:complete
MHFILEKPVPPHLYMDISPEDLENVKEKCLYSVEKCCKLSQGSAEGAFVAMRDTLSQSVEAFIK